jgi:hypothetical protein
MNPVILKDLTLKLPEKPNAQTDPSSAPPEPSGKLAEMEKEKERTDLKKADNPSPLSTYLSENVNKISTSITQTATKDVKDLLKKPGEASAAIAGIAAIAAGTIAGIASTPLTSLPAVKLPELSIDKGRLSITLQIFNNPASMSNTPGFPPDPPIGDLGDLGSGFIGRLKWKFP